MQATSGSLLAGRVRYAQPDAGFRSGIEPVLLAAAVPARSGDRVLEVGSGAGAALLCLASRIPGVGGVGVERDAGLVELARCNAAANSLGGLVFVAADIAAAGSIGEFDHACANPPYHPTTGTASSDAGRNAAKRGPPGLLAVWALAMGQRLRQRGTLTLILSSAAIPAGLAALDAAGCRPASLLPLWPRRGEAAKLVLLRGVRGARAPLRLLTGLTLHGDDGGFTAEADAVLREGAPLAL
ncbi:MAG TPA: methyltransferase [Acetobacteraceae bacterium]|nr:methyltransferase [Acetobacteraceae bacterium]